MATSASLCSADTLNEYGADVAYFDSVITFQGIGKQFPVWLRESAQIT
jgi:hypothetical protein